jgi:phage terminase large subunit-like protein
MTQEEKQQAHGLLAERFDEQQLSVFRIEERLGMYMQGLVNNPDHHNAYEILGALKFLRLLTTYEQDIKTFRDVIYKYEGVWEQRDGIWHHVEGGLRHPGTTGPTYYRLQPFQVFVLASMFLLKAHINTEAEAGSRELLPTEYVNLEGEWPLNDRKLYIYDVRRLCTEFSFYTPRKTAKTQLSAFIQFWYFMSGDENAECYCCANASDQAKILFSRTRELIHQMDPRERRIRFTASQVNWKPGQFRTASLTALSAGGKTKDGLFAQLCSADEYGSAAYVNGASDMGKLVSVVESSMGPRREPMTFISTTAGINTTGPFVDKLQGIRLLLEKELDPEAEHTLSEDRQACLLLEPDEWEQQDEELLLTSKDVRRKVNPMLGIIVQHSFYDDEIAKARQNPEKMNEVICKLLNVYKGAKVTKWITGDRIRPLQIDRRITDCRYQDGWQVFVGLDFSQGDDLFAVTYLAVDYTPSDTMRGRFFADTDCWVLEETMRQSPNRPLYEQWAAAGWLHICPGEVFDSMLAINRIADVAQSGVNIVSFGYDPAQSIQPINQLKAWLQTLFQRTDVSPKELADVIQRMVIPVSQTSMTQNPRVGELEHMILEKEPWLTFSMNPMWPWMFGNCAAELNSSDLRRIVKGGPQPTHKIDGVAALIDALYGFDLSEGRIDSN